LYPQQIPQRLAIQHNPAVVLEVAKNKKKNWGSLEKIAIASGIARP